MSIEKVWLGEEVDLEKLALAPLFVYENQQVFELLDLFREHHVTFALVTDEYGLIQGLITTGDIMNAIVRDIEEKTHAGMVKVDSHTWVLDGGYPIDEFKEHFHFEHLPDEERARYRTLSGLCMHQLGAIPQKGDSFTIGAYKFEILKVLKQRVEKVLLISKQKYQ